MDMLLKEMQEMDKFVQQPNMPIAAPSVINEVSKLKNQDQLWASAGPKSDESLAEVLIKFKFVNTSII